MTNPDLDSVVVHFEIDPDEAPPSDVLALTIARFDSHPDSDEGPVVVYQASVVECVDELIDESLLDDGALNPRARPALEAVRDALREQADVIDDLLQEAGGKA